MGERETSIPSEYYQDLLHEQLIAYDHIKTEKIDVVQ